MMKKILIAFIVLASSSLFISCDKPENQTSDDYLDEVINRAGRVIRDKKITSTSLGKDMNYNVILPPGYSEKKEFPFFYLLHGAGDNHNAWLDKGNAEAILKGYLKDGGKPMVGSRRMTAPPVIVSMLLPLPKERQAASPTVPISRPSGYLRPAQ